MGKRDQVGFATKFLSNRNYLNEVSVEGKKTSKFNFKIGFYDQYAAQVIRSGNCLTLLSNTITINKDTFWNTNYFEDLTRYVFWTFNKSFLLTLIEAIPALKPATVQRCHDLLQEHFIPYDANLEEAVDEELTWCLVKNSYLLKDPKYSKMYSLDKENRTALLNALSARMASMEAGEKENINKVEEGTSADDTSLSFLEMLKPLNNNPQETLDFIINKLQEADLDFPLFTRIPKLPSGKNPYGMNGAIAAMIDYFYQQGYFNKECSLEEIFQAYSSYTGNYIAKLKPFLSEFRQDKSYLKNFAKLKALKLSKLK